MKPSPFLTFLSASALAIGSLSLPAHAQETSAAAAATEEIDIEARKASIVNLEAHIEQQQARLSDLSEDIIRLDKRVEEGVDRVVKLLASVKDSPDSRTNVANTKDEAIEGLQNMIDYYQRKRSEVREALRTGDTEVPRDELSSDVEVFDERIEKRIEQIVTLTKSFTQHEDYKKYVNTGGGSNRWGWGWQSQEINEKWRQNRLDTRKTHQTREEVMEALKESIDDLDQRQKYLREKLRTGNISETAKDLYESDIDRIDGIIVARQKELEDLQSTIEKPGTKAVGRQRSWELSELLEDAKNDLRDDFFEIFRKYDELNRDRGQIAALQENLAARRQWIADWEAKQKQ